MKKELHVYRPPRGRFSGVFALVGGIVATIAVFVAIPLSQKISDMTSPPVVVTDEIEVAPPEFETIVDEPPPPEEEPPPPEQPPEQPSLDLGIDLGDLAVGTGGGVVLDIPKFALRGGDDAFGSGDLDSPPQPFSKPAPVFPSRLLSKGIGGKVLVECIIDASGTVVGTKIRQSSGIRELDDAAVTAVKKWKFKPAVSGGRKIKATAVVPFNFEVKR